MRQYPLFIATISLAVASVIMGQEPAGNEADAHNPSGPPGPMQSPSIWKVDPLTGALTIKIPIVAPLQGGRGPHFGYALSYNSASTITLQSQGVQNNYVVYQWVPAADTGTSFAPHGPWKWNGPYILNNYVNVADGPVYEMVNGTQMQVGYYDGCKGWGPFLYTDSDGGVHDLNVLGYQQGGSNNPINPGCQTYVNSSSISGLPNYTLDGSALLTKMSNNVATVYEPDGTMVQANGEMEDSNGNFNVNGLDSEGRVLLTKVSGNCGTEVTPGGTCTYSLQDATGITRDYTVTTAQETVPAIQMPHPVNSEVQPSTAYIGPTNYYEEGAQVEQNVSSYVMGVTSIGYPDGQSYSLQYNSTYGTVSKITFPTGGSVSFTWGIRAIGEVTSGVFAESTLVVTDVYLFDGGSNTSHWHYTYPNYTSGQQYPLQSTEVDPDGTTINHYSSASFLYSTVFTTGAPTFQETLTDIYAGSGAHVRSTNTAFVSAGPGMGHPHQVTTTYYDVSPAVQQCDQYVYDQWDNVVEKDESDLYSYSSTLCSVPSGKWLRKTFTSYPTSFCAGTPGSGLSMYGYSACPTGTPENFDAGHIVNKPSQVVVTDGSNHPYSLVQYGYDEVALITTTACGSQCYNHDDTKYPQSLQTGRGNLTSESRCSQMNNSTTLSPGSNGLITSSSAVAACTGGFLITHHTYDLTGQRVSTTDPVGNTTSFSYADSYSAGSPPGHTNSFLTRVTHPKSSLVDNYQYTWYTGQETSHSDWNSQETTYSYADSLGLSRLVQITGPSTELDGTTGSSASAVTKFSYSDSPYTGSSGTGFQITTQHQVDAKSTPTMTSSTVTFDGLARKINTSAVSPACSSNIQVNTAYDVMSRVYSVTNPFCSTSDPTYGITTHLYDALGREVQTTLPDGAVGTKSYAATAVETNDPFNGTTTVQHVHQADGLGRLQYVCEVSSVSLGSGNPSSCSLYVGATGYKTTYGYDPLNNLTSVNQYGLARSFQFDSVSRLTTSLNPEVSTETYAYNNSTSTPCGLNASAPCTRTDNRKVITSYAYDSMGRLTGKSYSAGSGNTTGPISDLNSCYQYDTQLTNVIDSYTNGQLTFEWQQSAACPTSPQTSIPSGAVAVRIKSLHDGAGRAGQEQQCLTGTGCLQKTTGAGIFRYTYNLLGNPVQSNNGVFAATVGATQTAQSTGNGTTMTAPSAPSVTWETAYDSADHINSSVVQDQPAWSGTVVWPSSAFSQAPTFVNINPANYDPFGHAKTVQVDIPTGSQTPVITTARQYDNRGRISLETDNGTGQSSSATHSLGTIVISGAEQGPTYPASSYAHATVTISGTEGDNTFDPCAPHGSCPQTIPDAGNITITINGTPVSEYYSINSTDANLAASFVSAINGVNSGVRASSSGGVITIRSTTPGTAGNGTATLSAGVTSNESQYYNPPSFSTSLSGSNLSGGQNVSPTVYDSGTVSVTINNQIASVSYNSSSTPQSIATQLSGAINSADNSFLSAQTDGDVAVLVSSSTGTSTDYSISVSVTYDNTDFNSASFAAVAPPMAEGDASDSSNGFVYWYFVPQGGYAPNGNILVQSDSVMGDWFYTYDGVDRLISATPDTSAPSQYIGNYGCWGYDAYGNRTFESLSTTPCSGTPPKASWATYNSGTNNQMTTSSYAPGGINYDASGNVANDGRNQYWFSAEGQVCAVKNLTSGSVTQYVYDAEGARVAEGTLSAAYSQPKVTCTPYSQETNPNQGPVFSLAKRFLVDVTGEQVTELNESPSSETWTHSSIFVAGRLTATYNTSGIHFALADPLGSKRVQVNNQGVVENSWTSIPFGNDINNPVSYSTPDATEHHFTGKERDAESGNDYFGARYYASSMGRFLSPDWSAKYEPIPYALLGDPQTLNLYAYVRNNPLSKNDPDGHCGAGGAPGQQAEPSDCSHVKVTVTPPTQPAPIRKVTFVDDKGKVHTGSSPSADLLMTVSVDKTPAAQVKVSESNQQTDTLNGETVPNAGSIDTKTHSDDDGHYKDTVGAPPTSPEKAQAYNGVALTIVDKQTQTLKFPNGCTCTATSTRTLTNTPDGHTISPNGYTLSTTQPVVATPVPQDKPQ